MSEAVPIQLEKKKKKLYYIILCLFVQIRLCWPQCKRKKILSQVFICNL